MRTKYLRLYYLIYIIITTFIGLSFNKGYSQDESDYNDVFLLDIDPLDNPYLIFSDAKNAVCFIKTDDGTVGTGVLVNNFKGDGKMYVLTSAHMLPGFHKDNYGINTLPQDIASMNTHLSQYKFDFSYQRYLNPNNNDEITDESPNELIGAKIISLYHKNIDYSTNLDYYLFPIDLVLLELSQKHSSDFRPYYAGWDFGYEFVKSSSRDQFIMHHPNGWVKKVSMPLNELKSNLWLLKNENGVYYINYTHEHSEYDPSFPASFPEDEPDFGSVLYDNQGCNDENEPNDCGWYAMFSDGLYGQPISGSSGSPYFNSSNQVYAIHSAVVIFSSESKFSEGVKLTNDRYINNPNFDPNNPNNPEEFRSLKYFLDPSNNQNGRNSIPGTYACERPEVAGIPQEDQNRMLRTYSIDEDITGPARGTIVANEEININADITQGEDLHIKSRVIKVNQGTEIPRNSRVLMTSGEINGLNCVTGCYGIEKVNSLISEDEGMAYIQAKNVRQIDYLTVTRIGTLGTLGTPQVIIGHSDTPRQVNSKHERINLFNISEITDLQSNITLGYDSYEVEVHVSNECDSKEFKGPLDLEQFTIEDSKDYQSYAEEVLPESTYSLVKKALLADAFQREQHTGSGEADDLVLAVDEQESLIYGMGFRLDGGFNESTLSNDVLFFLEDFNIYTDIRETQFGIDHQADLEAEYGYEPLTMDVYYPRYRYSGSSEGVKPNLPLILYVPTGSYLFEADEKLTKEIGRWFASKGYVFAALHTRKGMSITNGELTKRALFREWQDIRAAIQYWKGYNTSTHSNKWKIKTDKIFTLGHGSGGISVLSQTALDLKTYNSDYRNNLADDNFLLATTGNYEFTTEAEDILFNLITDGLDKKAKQWEERIEQWCNDPDLVKKFSKRFNTLHPTTQIRDDLSCTDIKNEIEGKIDKIFDFTTYNLNDYPSYPCFDNTACTVGNPADYYDENSSVLPQKTVALAGAIPQLEWLEHIDKANEERPVRVIYHEDDQVISPQEGEPFGDFLYVFEEANWVYNSTVKFPSYHGGDDMEKYTYNNNGSTTPVNNYKARSISGVWASGGPPRYHYPQAKTGLQYDINDGFESIIEPKVLYYIDAFFSKEEIPVSAPPRVAVADTLDFGKVSLRKSISKDIQIKNLGEQDLIVSNLSIPSGFTYDNAFGEGTVIQPADSLSFSVGMITTTLGAKSGNLTFDTNDPANPSVSVALTGEVVILSRLKFENNLVDENPANVFTPVGTLTYSDTEKAQGSHAVRIDAPDNFVQLPGSENSPLIKEVIEERTIAFWFKADTIQQSILYDEGGSIKGISFRLEPDGIRFGVKQRDINIETILGVDCMKANEWYHVAGIFNQGVLQIYINGVLKESESKDVSNLFTQIEGDRFGIGVGGIYSSTNYGNKNDSSFKGYLDDLQMYSTALTAAEITTLVDSAEHVSVSNPCFDPQVLVPSSLDFGNVAQNTSASNQITIENLGDEDLTVSNLSIPSGFSSSNAFADGTVIAPAGSYSLDLSMITETLGAKSGTLTFETNDPTNPAVSVALTGEVVTPPTSDLFVYNSGDEGVNGFNVGITKFVSKDGQCSAFFDYNTTVPNLRGSYSLFHYLDKNNAVFSTGNANFGNLQNVGWFKKDGLLIRKVESGTATVVWRGHGYGLSESGGFVAWLRSSDEVAAMAATPGNDSFAQQLLSADDDGCILSLEKWVSDTQFGTIYWHEELGGAPEAQARTASGTEQKVILSPNPTSGKISLGFETFSAGEMTFAIMSIEGRLLSTVKRQVTEGDQVIELDAEHLIDGLYFVKGVGGGTTFSVKFTVQKK